MMQKILIVFAIMMMFMPAVALGQQKCSDAGVAGLPPCSKLGTLSNPGDVGITSSDTGVGTVTTQTVVDAILVLINWFSWLIGVAAVVMGLYAGFLFITAGDDSGKIETARKILMWAIIGIAVAIFAFGIVGIATTLFGIVI